MSSSGATPTTSGRNIIKPITISLVLLLYSFVCYESAKESNAQLLRTLSIGLSSLLCFALVTHFTHAMKPYFLRGGLHGKDINKRGLPSGDVPIPESLGLIAALVYISMLCMLHLPGDRTGSSEMYSISMGCVTFMTLLGFTDDVIDLKWRHKIVLPLFSSMPLLVNYRGSTVVKVPYFIQPFVSNLAALVGIQQDHLSFGNLVNLGYGYFIYMALLSTFCANAINIHAGINGLEAGQVAVISFFMILHNAMNLNPDIPKDNLSVLRLHHSVSIDLIMPLLAVTLGLLYHNWYPSRVFVGDTFCNFSGMAIAMASILGHYSLTLLLLFIPQVINFLYSLPQLLGFVKCPRHRLPKFDKSTGKLTAVKSHLNLVNLTLWLCGPMTEHRLCTVLLILQAVCCTLGLALRAAYLKFVS